MIKNFPQSRYYLYTHSQLQLKVFDYIKLTLNRGIIFL